MATALEYLLIDLVRANPERTSLSELRDFLAPNGVVDNDRFAAVMIVTTRFCALIPNAETIFNTQLREARAASFITSPASAPMKES